MRLTRARAMLKEFIYFYFLFLQRVSWPEKHQPLIQMGSTQWRGIRGPARGPLARRLWREVMVWHRAGTGRHYTPFSVSDLDNKVLPIIKLWAFLKTVPMPKCAKLRAKIRLSRQFGPSGTTFLSCLALTSKSHLGYWFVLY